MMKCIKRKSAFIAVGMALYACCGVMKAEYYRGADNNKEQKRPAKFTNYIEEGTRWEMLAKTMDLNQNPPKLVEYVLTGWLEGYREINGKQYLVYWQGSGNMENKSETAYIRYDNGLVYSLRPGHLDEEERLLYDFNLTENEEVHLYMDSDYPDIVAKCTGLGEKEFGLKTYPVIKLECFGEFKGDLEQFLENLGFESGDVDVDLDLDQKFNLNWIPGIGAARGLLYNLYPNDAVRTAVYHNDELIYGTPPQPAGVGTIETDGECEPSNGLKYKPDGTLFRNGDKGIYIQNGRKYVVH
ncbi:MAG: hypothetical protein K2N88_00210 [Muribaculaceae bacterium]|nr:hypothetical protein [Muribaculaceae bacterium]